MTDSAQTLRDGGSHFIGDDFKMCRAATNEIERLRADLAHCGERLLDEVLKQARLQQHLDACNAANVKLAAENAELHAKLLQIIIAYDNYRGRGVAPAPTEYALVVAAIDAARGAHPTTSTKE